VALSSVLLLVTLHPTQSCVELLTAACVNSGPTQK
jgi:hypothetical protein